MQSYHKYFSAAEDEKKWGMYLVTAGHTNIEKDARYPPSGHPEEYMFNWNKGRILDGYYLVYIAKGKGVFESKETGMITIRGGTCFMLFPEMWHRYQPDRECGWEEYWFGLKGRVIDEWIREACISTRTLFYNTGFNDALIYRFSRLFEVVKASTPGSHLIMAGIAVEILGTVLRTTRKQGLDTAEQKIAWARSFIGENSGEPVHFEQLAADLNMSYSLFRKVFKEITHRSPGQYLLHQRIEKARELLSTTMLPVKEIAMLMGFQSLHYFSRVFKIKSGCSPLDYRKRYYLR